MDICVFGSSSQGLDGKYISAVEALGEALGRRGHNLVFGGYDLGLMGAIARGVHAGGGKVTGVVTEGLSAQAGRPVYPCDQVVSTADLAARKAYMLNHCQAVISAPGGMGTLDELTDVLSQAKAGEGALPCALFDVEGFYDPLVTFLDNACATGLNSSNWRATCGVFDNAAAVLDYLEGFC